MKKYILFVVGMAIGLAIMAQSAFVKPGLSYENFKRRNTIDYAPEQHPSPVQQPKFQQPGPQKSGSGVSIIDLGTAANAFSYGFAGGQRAILAVNNDINTIIHGHRMGGTLGGYNGDLCYDISKDGGITWATTIRCYDALIYPSWYFVSVRYPNFGICNPSGNFNPDEAYVTFFAPGLDFSNGNFGCYSWGRAKIGDATDTTKHLISSEPNAGRFQYIPDGFTVTDMGDFWAVDLNQDWRSDTLVWLDEMIISHGIWDNETKTYTLEQNIMACQTTDSAGIPPMLKIEFASDGQVGYIVALADNGSVEISANRSYYPILWRTEDGGLSWSDPMVVPLAGDEGIHEVQHYLKDSEIAEIYLPPVPARDQIPFTTAFDFDLSVDAWGNPHIAVMIGVTGAEPYSIITDISPSTHYSYVGAFLLSSDDKGNPDSWMGYRLGRTRFFRGAYGTEVTEDNRIQIARSQDAKFMFVAWLDSDSIVATENNCPDIWCRGVDLVSDGLSYDTTNWDSPTNVTYGSDAAYQAHFFAMANRTFRDDSGNFIIPFSFQEMNTWDPLDPVQYKYIQDFKFHESTFWYFDVREVAADKTEFISVSQTMPNPANAVARFNVTLAEAATVNVTVTNMMGQTVQSMPASRLQAGVNEMQLNVSALSSGVYFYTVEAGKEAVTRKMIVK
ncbi:T9SS type A sorting domain-containing protein [Candidatus Falkowbacteria bacterium]|nr:T9SS type A sorting domain-containing protein [Candidatus Falkowbacteria bacterium]